MALDVSTSIVIRRPCHEVAAYAAKPDNAPYWRTGVEAVSWLSPRPLASGSRVSFVMKLFGRRFDSVCEVVELVPGRRLTVQSSRGLLPLATTFTWDGMSPAYTLMTMRVAETRGGVLSVAAPALALTLRRANARDLARLKAILEQGVRAEEYAGGAELAEAG